MSGDLSYPPPGTQPGSPPPPGWAPPPPAAEPTWAPPPPGHPGGPAPGMLGAAHKPGAIPLRPLGLGEIFDAAFRIIRFNPRATVGSAVLVAAVAMAIPVLATAVLSLTLDLSLDPTGDQTTAEAAGTLSAMGTLVIGGVLQSIGLVFVTGMVAHVTAAAAIGRRLSLGEAWAATRGSRWRLVGLTVLLALMSAALLIAYGVAWVAAIVLLPVWAIVVFGVVTVPLFTALMCWFWIRCYYLPAPVLMIERIGVLAAIGRGFRLTRRQFWRTFGIALLTLIVTQIAASFLAIPFAIIAQVASLGFPDARFSVLVVVLANALGTVASTAFVAPFVAAVTSLQYIDQRMRKEAYDVELMTKAGITSS